MAIARFPSAPTIPDLGFGLLPAYHGKGYATEAAEALVKYYREEKGVKAFAGFCEPGNEGSSKVFRRMGWMNRGVRDVKGVVGEEGVLRCVVWTVGVGEGEGDMDGIGMGL